jgi:uncharacterized membrane protein YczE
MYEQTAVPLPLRLVEMGTGLTALSFGTVLMIRAGLGQSNGTAMLTVFSYITGIRVGTLMALMFLIFIFGEWLLLKGNFGIRHLIQISVAWIQGGLVNFFQYDCAPLQNLYPSSYGISWLYIMISLLFMATGSAAIICADLIQMPVEGFALEVSRYFHINFGKVRQAIDVVWLALAIMGLLYTGMASTIREGTLFYTLVFGRSINRMRPIIRHAESQLLKYHR